MNTPKLSIVVPAFNEASHLETVITEMDQALGMSGIEYEICIVNNGSTDATESVISKIKIEHPRVNHIFLQHNQQYGGGVLAGLQSVKGETLGWMHADGQADPEDLVRLYKKMQKEGCELGKAVRITSSESVTRKILSFIYFRIFQLLFLASYRDPNGTPKLMTRAAMRKLSLASKDWFLDPEFVIKGIRNKMPIAEIETTWRSRKSGTTKARLIFAGFEFFKNMLLYRFGSK